MACGRAALAADLSVGADLEGAKMTALPALLLLVVLTGAHPGFEDYPAAPPCTGKPADANIQSHPSARRYRTALREASRRGPDFAGHFSFVRIGCGSSCNQFAVIDVQDGTVFFPRGLQMAQWAGWWHHPAGPDYRRSSRLLVIGGVVNDDETKGRYGFSYLLWNGTDFQLLRFEPRDRGRPPR
jgi:hypothetical protein